MSGGTVDKTSATTDENGEVYALFTAQTEGSGYVRFICPSCVNESIVNYSLSISEFKATSGAYEINWERSEYVVTGTEGQISEVQMIANTTPKAIYATVEFTTDNPYAVFTPNRTSTDTNGNVSTTLKITPQPDWDWLTLIKAYVTTLASGDTALIKFYLTKIWTVDTYDDFVQGIFFDNTELAGSSGGDGYVILKKNTTNWLSGWNYRKQINISSIYNLTDYQLLVTVDTASLISAGKMRSDCGDIRFTESDCTTKLNYWIESGCNSGTTKIWVKANISSGNSHIYMYYGNSYATSESSLSNTFDAVGEAGIVSVGGSEITVNFANSYTNPHVFAVPRLNPGVYRSGKVTAQHHLITEVSTTYFKIKQVESPSKGDGTIDTTQVAYLVLEDGIYYIGTSLLAEVDTTSWLNNWVTVTFSAPFSSTPAVIADVQGPGTQGSNVHEDIYARGDEVSTTSYRVQAERDDDSTPNGVQTTIAYAAIQQGFDNINSFEARKTSDSITDSFTSITYSTSYSSAPVVVAQLVREEDDPNSFYAVTRDVTSFNFELAGEEPASWDGPHTTEEFSWISVPQGTIYGRKYVSDEPTISIGNEETVKYVSSGTYSSYVKDLTQNSTITYLQWSGSIETGTTDITFYIRASNNSFTKTDISPTWSYVGKASDGTQFDLQSLNIIGRYVQLKAELSTNDNTKTPILDEVTVGYKPIS
ncbi:hypothetical protein DRP05_13995 [Archaeoglobales archaeon]|nr:MAG: hypothetical protein DRP05_13995 [Archaeoglobales archaeon]